MIIALIAAHDPDLVIGAAGGLPWHYKADLLYFKKTTMGKPVLMGRGVFEEIGEKPLPGRRNVVLSRTRNYPEVDVEVYESIGTAMEALKNEKKIFIIGGGEIYNATIASADELYITQIHTKYTGDTYFPEYRDQISTKWREVWREDHPKFSFIRYENKGIKS